MNKLKYSEVMDLRFIRERMSDDVFLKQYGFECFFMTLKLNKNISLQWDCATHLVTLYKNYKTFKKDISKEEIIFLTNLFK